MSDVGFCKFLSKVAKYNLRWLVVTVTQQENPVLLAGKVGVTRHPARLRPGQRLTEVAGSRNR